MSKTFENFLKAKDRQEVKAKEKIDKLNHEAIKKVKYETLAKRTQKETRFEIKSKIEKEQEKATAVKRRKDAHVKEIAGNAMDLFKV